MSKNFVAASVPGRMLTSRDCRLGVDSSSVSIRLIRFGALHRIGRELISPTEIKFPLGATLDFDVFHSRNLLEEKYSTSLGSTIV